MNEIDKAKAVLRDAGFYVDNLWHIDDVKGHFECTDEQAQEILEDALTNDWIMEQIYYGIRYASEEQEILIKKQTP